MRLAMYASPPPLAEATAVRWTFLSKTLKRAGLDEVPATLDDAVDYHQAWTRPDLLFRAAIAPLSLGGRFFSSIVETGGHRNSIAAITAGNADVAAIDCVTYGNVLRFDPESLAGIRILTQTVSGPGLPFITRGNASDQEVTLLRQGLQQAVAEPSLAPVRDVLRLKDFAVLSDADYEPLAALERQAQRLGYPLIA